ncbi:MAG: hypothetical protein GY758_09165 [Fuerstiella sp.]|nr:hypothetical protein [Fuerstiella sp.]MCP4504861.1 hypothetical protein [Fuerstiella sp.]
MSNQKIKFSDEQLWQAFQYVAAELSVADTEAFEQQLLLDVALCDAVATATVLTSTVAAGGRQRGTLVPSCVTLPQKSHPKARHRMVAVTASACCCLALVLFLSLLPGTSGDLSVSTAQENVADAEWLVAVWSENFADHADEESDYDDSAEQELAVPDWLVAAVTLPDVDEIQRSDMPTDKLMPDDMGLF